MSLNTTKTQTVAPERSGIRRPGLSADWTDRRVSGGHQFILNYILLFIILYQGDRFTVTDYFDVEVEVKTGSKSHFSRQECLMFH